MRASKDAAPVVSRYGPSPTDLGYTRDRIHNCASRLKATCDGFGRFATFAPQGDGRRLAWVSQHRDLAAVEIDGGAVHPGGARRDQKRDEIGDVLDFAEAGDAG